MCFSLSRNGAECRMKCNWKVEVVIPSLVNASSLSFECTRAACVCFNKWKGDNCMKRERNDLGLGLGLYFGFLFLVKEE